MKQLFIGKYIWGFGRVMDLTSKLMHKSKEAERRERILIFWKKYGLDATKDAFDVGRSTLFLWKKKQKKGDLEPKSKRPKNVRQPVTPFHIVDTVSQYRRVFPFLGKDKLEKIIKDIGINISASTIGRIIKRENLPSSPKKYISRSKRKKKDRLSKDYPINRPGDLIGMDTIVIQENGIKKYIVTAVDYYTRIAVARAYSAPNSRNAKDLLLRMKIALGNDIKAVNTDNGSEFMAEYEKACISMQIKHFYTYPRTPKMNPFAERFNRTIQEEARFPLFEETFEVWNNFIGHYVMLYNFFRPHYSLDYKTPVDIYLKSKQSNMWWTHTKP
jgi:transposase InsO family protein